MSNEKGLERHFRTLGLSTDASPDDVERACRELSATWDPDRMPDVAGLKDSARKKLQEIQAAAASIRAVQARKAGQGIGAAAGSASLFDEIFSRRAKGRRLAGSWLIGLVGAAAVLLVVAVVLAPSESSVQPALPEPVIEPAAGESSQEAPVFEPGKALQAIRVVDPAESRSETVKKSDKPAAPVEPKEPARPKPRLVRPEDPPI